jgi:hypothetical protein
VTIIMFKDEYEWWAANGCRILTYD